MARKTTRTLNRHRRRAAATVTPAPAPRARLAPTGVTLLWTAAIAWTSADAAPPALPVPCAAGACGVNGPTTWNTVGTASAAQKGNTLTVKQTSASAVLNWSQFNIGAGGSVVFNQPSSSSVALNRIYQASPSSIFGQLTANGQVYLVNLNGFLFGPTATVNTSSLLVSSLPLSDSVFKNGLLSALPNQRPALGSVATDTAASFGATAIDPFVAPGSARSSVLDLSGSPVLDANGQPQPVGITIQNGAQLTSTGGRLLFAGQSVNNAGSLSTPDGQTILAAGTQVYLQASSDVNLRGLVVEVDSGSASWNDLASQVSNQAGGVISAPRGNITLVGLAVNQQGRLSATTSVAANGSIRLEAADTHQISGGFGNFSVSSSRGGTLEIGPQSSISILPELDSTATEVPAQTQLQSSVTLLGQQVFVHGGSITAPDGLLAITAAANPSSGIAGDNTNARLRIDTGATIDLSGSTATLPVDANLVTAQLRTSELANDPNQRNGALRGQTVIVDARTNNGNGTPTSFADLSGEVASVAQNVAQRTEQGGTATIQSEGDVVIATGTTINVSGGATNYLGGNIQTSYLVGPGGALYPIGSADPSLTYTGVVNPTRSVTFDKWGIQEVLPATGLSTYQAGYVQGAAAGSIQVAAPAMVLNGTLVGTAQNGPYQRGPATTVPGGQLTIGLKSGIQAAGELPYDYFAPGVTLAAGPEAIAIGDDQTLPGPVNVQLPVAYVTNGGFTSTSIYSNQGFSLPAGLPLSLLPGSSFTVNAARVDIGSSITAPSGTLSFSSVDSLGFSTAAGAARSGVYVGDDVTLDVRGLWTNDVVSGAAQGLGPTWSNGGTITLGLGARYAATGGTAAIPAIGAELELGNNVSLRASGGAWANPSGVVTGGAGGAITVNAGMLDGALAVGNGLAVDGFGVNGAKGGSFSLQAPRISLSNGPGGAWTTAQTVDDLSKPGAVFDVYAPLFTDYGFAKVSLNASGTVVPGATSNDVFTVQSGTTIRAVTETLQLDHSAITQASARNVAAFAAPLTLPLYQRTGEAITLSAVPSSYGSLAPGTPFGQTQVGDLTVQGGSTLTTDPGGSIALQGVGSVEVGGTLRAPGGTITLQVADSPSYDSGYIPGLRVELDSSGVLDVGGTTVLTNTTPALVTGTVSPGGTVNLFADRGAVVADLGSTISIAGTSASLGVANALGSVGPETVASAAGTLAVHSPQAISLLGTIDARAGVGTEGTLASGTLSLQLTRGENWWTSPSSQAAADTFNQSPLGVVLVDNSYGPTLSGSGTNRAVLNLPALAASGLDAVSIEAGGLVEFSSSVPVSLGRQLSLDAPVYLVDSATTASLSAPYLSLGSHVAAGSATQSLTASPGTGSVSLSGSDIDLIGHSVFQGASHVTLVSAGDLRLRGSDDSSTALGVSGSLVVDGNLTLDAARVYPTTGTQFSITAGTPGSGADLTIGQTAASPGTPLSAAGGLTFRADAITSDGSVYAPFGSVTYDGNASVTLGAGSLTSVSGAGLTIPFGQTTLGALEWIYAYNGQSPVGGVPTRAVTLAAPSVTVAPQATIDVSGGGNLQAYEWVPGSGGKTDALAPAGTAAGQGGTPGLYAIVPSLANQLWPADPQEATALGEAANATITLSAGSAIPAGTYALLPARYALMPGAYLVQAQPTYQSATGGMLGTLGDGTKVVGGYFSYGTTGLQGASGYTGFAIRPGSYGGELAEYTISEASSYFAAQAAQSGSARPTLPADAGILSIAATNSLTAAGSVLTTPATGGLGATIELSTRDLYVGPAAGAPAGAVVVSDTVLEGWKPGTLLLGGTFASGGGISVVADQVTVGSGASLSADSVVLVAGQAIDLKPGAQLRSTSGLAGGSAPSAAPPESAVTLTGEGSGAAALLAVSDLSLPIVNRPAGITGGGTVAVEGGSAAGSGAVLASRGALAIDGPGGVTLAGTLTGAGAEWSLGSSSIAFAAGTSSADALTISPALVSQLSGASSVRLASTGAIDLYTAVLLGLPANGIANVTSPGSLPLASLTLSAQSINNAVPGSTAGASGANDSYFAAQRITLGGPNPTGTATAVSSTSSTLGLIAGELDVGPGTVVVNGFGTTTAKVFGAVVGSLAPASTSTSASATTPTAQIGAVSPGGLVTGGDLSLTAGEVTAAGGAQTTLGALGTLTVAPLAGATNLPVDLGGDLTLHGATVNVSGTVAAPAGLLTVQGTQAVTLGSGATLSVAGLPVIIENQTIGAPGGALTVTSGGSLSIDGGATLSAAAVDGANAGRIALSATGLATVAGTLDGAAAGGGNGGRFSLDAGSLAGHGGNNGLTALAGSLAQAGFTSAIDVRARTGDLVLAPGSSLTANQLTVSADAGEVTIAGTLSAPSGALRGRLGVFGGSGVELASTGVLLANGAGATGRGGEIELSAGALSVDAQGNPTYAASQGLSLDAGSQISAQGSALAGTVLLRAPALAASNDVAINRIDSTFNGVGGLSIEPVQVFGANQFATPGTVSGGDWSTVQGAVQAYNTASNPVISARFSSGSLPPLLIQPGVEIVAVGDLTIAQNTGTTALDLSPGASNWRFNGAPVDLTVLATGNLIVNGSLSDGYDQAVAPHNARQPVLSSGANAGPSASIGLVAGADLASANPLVAVALAAADLTIGNPGAATVVRTGTGDINLVAARNLAVYGEGSGAYTSGTPLIAPGGTASDPYAAQSAPAASPIGTDQPYGIVSSAKGANLVFSFPTAGGNLTVDAGQDVLGQALTDPGVPNWQLRQGGFAYNILNADGTRTPTTSPAQWGVNLAAYNWNFGTLGGGDLVINAGRDALNVTAAAVDSRVAIPGVSALQTVSGGLSVYAGRDLGTPELFLADGRGSVTANGAVSAILPNANTAALVGSAFYLQNSSLQVDGRLGIAVDGIYNPTALGQPVEQTAKQLQSTFYTYGPQSGLGLVAVAGDIQIGGAANAAPSALLGPNVANAGVLNASVIGSSLDVDALGGSVYVGTTGYGAYTAALYPSATGQLRLAAATDVAANGSAGAANFVMSDATLATLPTVDSPLATGSVSQQAFSGAIHTGDTQPAIVAAGRNIDELNLSIPKASEILAGQDIVDLSYKGQNLSTADLTLVSAGRDISYLTTCSSGCEIAVGGPGRLDLLAGRNVDLGFSEGVTTDGNIRNANLPTANGSDLTIVTGAAAGPHFGSAIADLISPTDTSKDLAALTALPAAGTSGFSSALASFLTSVVEPSPAYAWELAYYVRNVTQTATGKDPGPLSFAAAQSRLATFSTAQQSGFVDLMQELIPASAAGQQSLVQYVQTTTGASGLSVAQAFKSFAALPGDAQRPYTEQLFLGELTASGQDANSTTSLGLGGFARGYAAIDALFPHSRAASSDYVAGAYQGDLTLAFSRIYTLSGGNLSLFVPGGSVNVGLANPPPQFSARPASTLGIVAEGAGNVSIYARGDVNVNTSRVFTLGGGNILVWSNQGSIDAGRGAKTAVSAPPPQALISADGTVTLNFAGAATGSGIRTIQTNPDQPLGNVDLIAPEGTVNAGDAGIGAAGNINIAAQHVLGLDNIQVGGTSTGVPAQVSSLGASLLGASNAGSSTTQSATESATAANDAAKQGAAPLADAALGWLEVFVTGLGEENCRPDDIECLKRQKK